MNFATARADELDGADLVRGGRRLERTARRWKPRVVAILGMDAYRKAFGARRATVGEQDVRLGEARVWVLPNTSGLQASYQLSDLVRLFGDLRREAAATAGARVARPRVAPVRRASARR